MRLNFAIFLTVLAVASVNDARSLYRRQVPQEHSHEALLTAMRAIMPAGTPSIQGDGNIPDVVFGLLGNKAAGDQAPTKGAAGGICLQQDIADTAIGLAAGDKTKIATALKYRALERNSGSVGGKSDLCTKAPKSKELVGLTQHQDAASEGAAAFNKNVEITLAKKLGELGIDPLQALETVTFGPGQKGDPTAKGLSCNEETDKAGCIFTKKLNVAAATEAELLAAGGGAGGAGTAAATAGAGGAGTGAGAAGGAAGGAGGATGGAAAGGDSQAIIDSMIAELEQLKTLCAAA